MRDANQTPLLKSIPKTISTLFFKAIFTCFVQSETLARRINPEIDESLRVGNATSCLDP